MKYFYANCSELFSDFTLISKKKKIQRIFLLQNIRYEYQKNSYKDSYERNGIRRQVKKFVEDANKRAEGKKGGRGRDIEENDMRRFIARHIIIYKRKK